MVVVTRLRRAASSKRIAKDLCACEGALEAFVGRTVWVVCVVNCGYGVERPTSTDMQTCMR